MYWLKAYPIQSLQTFSLQQFCVTHYKKKDLFRYDFSRKTLETLYTTWIIQFGPKVFTEGFYYDLMILV